GGAQPPPVRPARRGFPARPPTAPPPAGEPPPPTPRHVPTPTAGIGSPLAGMGRLNIWGAAPAPAGSAAAAAISRSTPRRVSRPAGFSSLPLIPRTYHDRRLVRPAATFTPPPSSQQPGGAP